MPYTATIAPGVKDVIVGGNGPYQAGDAVTLTDAAYVAMDPAVFATVFTAPPVLQGGGGGGAVDSVNGETGAVVLDAGDVGAGSQEAVVSQVITTGDINPMPNTSAAWQKLGAFELAIPAAVGDHVQLEASGMRNQSSALVDFAIMVGSSLVWFSSTGTGTPATDGNPGWYAVANFWPHGGPAWLTVGPGHLDGGNIRWVIATKAAGTGIFYASPTWPFRWRAINKGPVS
jgi:hypothetical protein